MLFDFAQRLLYTLRQFENWRGIMAENWQPISFDCRTFNCADACCHYGVDVFPHERAALLEAGLAVPENFTEPEVDEMGQLLYRTQTNEYGCVFLLRSRGCRLHPTGKKPSICILYPRDHEEALDSYKDGDLPCYPTMMGTE
jgi:hypothetical protein